MSDIKLNPNQQKFVDINCNMLVSANAGSGKTSTMISKIKKLILEDKIDVNKFLVVTFTNYAGFELKHRLYEELVAAALTSDASEKEYICKQIEDLNNSCIGTLHSVCNNFLNKYFYAVGLEPGFKIVGDSEQRFLFSTALNTTLESYIINNDSEFLSLYESYNSKRNLNALKSIISDLYNFSKAQINYESWKDYIIKNNFNLNINKNIYANFALNYYKNNLVAFLDDITECKKMDDKFGFSLGEAINNLLNFIYKIKQTNTVSDFIKNVFNFNLNLPKKNTKRFADNLSFYEKVYAVFNDFKERWLKKVKEDLNEELLLNFKTQSNSIKTTTLKLFEIVNKLDEEYLILKRQRNLVDFQDLEKLAIDLLNNKGLQAEITSNIKYVFVDEYQDINSVQEFIITKLSSNAKLFMVGDVKQSIYAFRLCDPQIFVDKYNTFIKDNKENIVVNLNENYRSVKPILDYANMLFSHIITKQTMGIDYDDNRLIGGVEVNFKTTIPAVEINLINKKGKEGLCDENDALDEGKFSVECEHIAKSVLDMMGKPYFNAKTGKVESIEYKDIVILTRDKDEFVVCLYNTFNKYSIPCNVRFKRDIFNCYENLLLINLLSLIDYKYDDISLVSVLTSFMYGVPLEELSFVFENYSNETAFNKIKDYSLKNKDNVSMAFNKLISDLKDFRKILTNLKVCDLVDYIYNKYNYKTHFYNLHNGETLLNNIEKFFNIISSEVYDYALGDLLNYIKNTDEQNKIEINIAAGVNCVNILTMHQSKGLEYPCVFLVELGKQFNRNVFRMDAILTKELGLGVDYIDSVNRIKTKSLCKAVSQIKKQNQEIEEQIRLLYVAVTRAKSYLKLFGTCNFDSIKKQRDKNIYASTSFLDLVLKPFSGGDIEKLIIKGKTTLEKEITCNLLTENPKIISKSYKFSFIEANNNQVQKITELIKFKYPYQVKGITLKNSVSSILGLEDYVNSDYNVNKISTNNQHTNLGIAYHKIMQMLDYNLGVDNAEEVVNALYLNGEIEKDIKDLIDINKIKNAFHKIKKLLTSESKVLKEAKFLMQSDKDGEEKILIQGVADLVIINNNKAIVVDFKTNKNLSKLKLIETYKKQLNLYALAVESAFKLNKTTKYIYSFEHEELIELA